MRDLLAITTAGRIEWLRGAIQSLRDDLDVLVVDDASPPEIGVEKFCKERGLMLITKPKAYGATDSLNKAYNFFKQKGYRTCIISNDDVLFPPAFWRGLVSGVWKHGYNLLGPLSNAPGDGKEQQIERFLNIVASSTNIDQIQQALFQKYHGEAKWAPCSYFNGFCFAFGPSIAKFKFSKELLFNPVFKNLGNEIDLTKRIIKRGGKIGMSKISYVFHWKHRTYKHLKLKHRDDNWR